MADNSKSGYIGKISNSGAQKVEAPVKPKTNTGKSTVKSGDDLRN